jgi:pseudouridine synthase
MSKIRLQKFLSQNNICSRRRAEELINSGKIKINGQLAKLGDKVDDSDTIKINSQEIKKQSTQKTYLMLNKPIGYTCTKRQFKGEKNIYQLLPKKYHHLNSAGRLDKNSQGLLILTNDGDYIYKMTHPKFKQEKEYIVETQNLVSKKNLDKFKQGINIGKEEKEIVKCKSAKQLSDNKFSIIITQGKKRQIRRMCASAGLKVIELKRVREGKLKLSDLKIGEWKEIKI